MPAPVAIRSTVAAPPVNVLDGTLLLVVAGATRDSVVGVIRTTLLLLVMLVMLVIIVVGATGASEVIMLLVMVVMVVLGAIAG